MDGRAVTHRMRMNALAGEARRRGVSQRRILPQEVAEPEPCQGLSAAIAEDPFGGRPIEPRLREKRPQNLCGPGPERTDPLLASLAEEPDLKRPDELEVPRPEVEELLYAGTGIEHHDEKGVVPASRGTRAVDGVEHGADLVVGEVLDDARASPLEGHGEETLADFEVLGVLRGDEAGEGVDGREAGVARHGAVAAGGLKVIEERDHAAGIDVADVEIDDVPSPAGREEPEQQREGVAVTEDSVRAEAARQRHVLRTSASRATCR